MAAPLQFAIIGCGLIGRKRAASLAPGQLRYACDLDISRAVEITKIHPAATALAKQKRTNEICNSS